MFKHVPEFLVLVTPLLGLKGNLEMTLASRLSTHANLGHMDTPQNQWHICFGNLSLTQVQVSLAGLDISTHHTPCVTSEFKGWRLERYYWSS